MSDDLIKRLRKRGYFGTPLFNRDGSEADDYIEDLEETRDTMGRLWSIEAAEKQVALGRAEATEAKLAKAVERLRNIRELNMTAENENGHEWANSDLIEQEIVAALAELEGKPNE